MVCPLAGHFFCFRKGVNIRSYFLANYWLFRSVIKIKNSVKTSYSRSQ